MGRRGGALLGICLLLAGCAGAPADPPLSPEEASLLADFQRSAYGAVRPVLGNDGAARTRRNHLAKWLIPIRIGLIAESGDDIAAYSAMVERHRQDLVAATGLDIAVAGPEDANMLIFFGADPFATAQREKARYGHLIRDPRAFNALLAQMEQSATCFGLLWGGWPSGRTIDFSVVFVRTNLGPRTVEGCLVQETTQILGLLHDLDPEADSVFSDSGKQVHLTDRDRLLLQLLYDPRLRPGMGWAEVEPLARAVLRELLASAALPAGQQ